MNPPKIVYHRWV